MTIYLLLFILPMLAWVAIAKLFLHLNFTWGEVAVQAGATSLVIFLLFLIGTHSQTADVMFVNGVVEELEPRKESCPSGWTSFKDGFCTNYRTRQVKVGETCSTNSTTKVRTCTPIYDTEYNYDYSWERRYFVHADYLEPFNDSTYEIARIDSQGVKTPPAFSEVEIGDPVTKRVSYTNYIKGASNSLFSEEPPGDAVVLAYPRVKQQWKASRVMVSGLKIDSDEWEAWNEHMMEINSNVRSTGANAIVILTNDGRHFSEMLARAWHAHNINDVVTVIGMDGDQIAWVDVTSWSNDSLVNVEIRDKVLDLKTLDMQKVGVIIQDAIAANFELKDMKEFEYLADDVTPPTWVFVLALLVLLVVTPAITYVFNKYEVL